jgi:hypothetical protein
VPDLHYHAVRAGGRRLDHHRVQQGAWQRRPTRGAVVGRIVRGRQEASDTLVCVCVRVRCVRAVALAGGVFSTASRGGVSRPHVACACAQAQPIPCPPKNPHSYTAAPTLMPKLRE